MLELSPVKALKLLPSVRADYASDIKDWVASPRFAARYDVASGYPRTTLKGGVGPLSPAAAGLRVAAAVRHAEPEEQPVAPHEPRLRAGALASGRGVGRRLLQEARPPRRSAPRRGEPAGGRHVREQRARGGSTAASSSSATSRTTSSSAGSPTRSREANVAPTTSERVSHLRLRPDAHPHRARELPARPRLGGRRALEVRHRQPVHARRVGHRTTPTPGAYSPVNADAVLGPRRGLPPSRRPHRQDVDVHRLEARRLSRRAERLLPEQPGRPLLQLQLRAVGRSHRTAVPPRHRSAR